MQIRWKNKDAAGSVDHLPDEWFARDTVCRRCTHNVVGSNWELKARCNLTCSGDRAILDYAADDTRKSNESLGIYIGQTVIQFLDDNRADIVEIRWAEPNQPARALVPPPEAQFGGEVSEGFPVVAKHIRYERSQALRLRKLRQSDGTCAACGINHFANSDLSPIVEVHHNVPVSTGKNRNSTKDLSVLCPTCHRAIHKSMRQAGTSMTVAEFKERYFSSVL